MAQVIIKDETASGDILNEISFEIDKESITLRGLITTRVETEVAKFNKGNKKVFNGLIKPTAAEAELNGYRFKKRKLVDVEKQVYVALDAFSKNGYFVFVNDEQVTDLDQELLVGEDTSVSFLKLTPLVGG